MNEKNYFKTKYRILGTFIKFFTLSFCNSVKVPKAQKAASLTK